MQYIADFEAEAAGLEFGTVKLEAHIRDGKPRYVIGRERSIIPEAPTSEADKGTENE